MNGENVVSTGSFEHFLQVTRKQEDRDRERFAGRQTNPALTIGTIQDFTAQSFLPETTQGTRVSVAPRWSVPLFSVTCERCEGKGRAQSFAGSMRCPVCQGGGWRDPTIEEASTAFNGFAVALNKVLVEVVDSVTGWANKTLGPMLQQFAHSFPVAYASLNERAPVAHVRRARSGPRRRR